MWKDSKQDFALEFAVISRYVFLAATAGMSVDMTNDLADEFYYQFSRNTRNCSLELASGEVEQKRTKNCCLSFSLGMFKFFI